MNLVGLDGFLPALRQIITGPLDPWLEDALMASAVKFCRESEFVTDSRVVAELNSGASLTVSRNYDLLAVKLLGAKVVENGRDRELIIGQDYFAQSTETITALVTLTALSISYVVAPRSDVGVVPEALETHHLDTIAAGAAAILYMQPERPWSDPARGKFYSAEFKQGIRNAFRLKQEQALPEQISFRNPTRARTFY